MIKTVVIQVYSRTADDFCAEIVNYSSLVQNVNKRLKAIKLPIELSEQKKCNNVLK